MTEEFLVRDGRKGEMHQRVDEWMDGGRDGPIENGWEEM